MCSDLEPKIMVFILLGTQVSLYLLFSLFLAVAPQCACICTVPDPLVALPFIFCYQVMKESFGPRKENNSLKGPLLNHLTWEKTKHNFSYILMLQASCIYLGLISPFLETYHPLHPPRRLITPCPTASVISTKEYSKYPS